MCSLRLPSGLRRLGTGCCEWQSSSYQRSMPGTALPSHLCLASSPSPADFEWDRKGIVTLGEHRTHVQRPGSSCHPSYDTVCYRRVAHRASTQMPPVVRRTLVCDVGLITVKKNRASEKINKRRRVRACEREITSPANNLADDAFSDRDRGMPPTWMVGLIGNTSKPVQLSPPSEPFTCTSSAHVSVSRYPRSWLSNN
jgi:hypothetical protein